MDGPAMGQALQLGRRSNQLPDVHSLAGLDGSPSSLQGAGWFQPLTDVDGDASPVGDFLLDGGENTLRLAYSGVTPPEIDEGISRLAEAVRSLGVPSGS